MRSSPNRHGCCCFRLLGLGLASEEASKVLNSRIGCAALIYSLPDLWSRWRLVVDYGSNGGDLFGWLGMLCGAEKWAVLHGQGMGAAHSIFPVEQVRTGVSKGAHQISIFPGSPLLYVVRKLKVRKNGVLLRKLPSGHRTSMAWPGSSSPGPTELYQARTRACPREYVLNNKI